MGDGMDDGNGNGGRGDIGTPRDRVRRRMHVLLRAAGVGSATAAGVICAACDTLPPPAPGGFSVHCQASDQAGQWASALASSTDGVHGQIVIDLSSEFILGLEARGALSVDGATIVSADQQGGVVTIDVDLAPDAEELVVHFTVTCDGEPRPLLATFLRQDITNFGTVGAAVVDDL